MADTIARYQWMPTGLRIPDTRGVPDTDGGGGWYNSSPSAGLPKRKRSQWQALPSAAKRSAAKRKRSTSASAAKRRSPQAQPSAALTKRKRSQAQAMPHHALAKDLPTAASTHRLRLAALALGEGCAWLRLRGPVSYTHLTLPTIYSV